MQPDASSAAAAVDQQRQWDWLMRMAALGGFEGAGGAMGVNRACLTPLDREARRALIGWAQSIGATVSVDAAANLWFRRAGSEPGAAPVLTGSHMDSQPEGGRFDGIYGVVAGLEVLAALHQAGLTTRRPIEVVAWTNEEGGRFAPGCMGSMAWAGHTPITAWADTADAEGIRFADALAEQLAAEADLPRRALGHKPHAYIEAHIEQGPLLEARSLAIGAVTGIQGSRWFTVTIAGESAHAGTAPLRLRRDAVQDMVRAIAALNALTHDPDDILRFTVGRIAISPNSSNSVAARATFSIDLRHPDAATLTRIGDAIPATIQAALETCTAEIRETFHAMPAAFDPGVVQTIADAAEQDGLSHTRLASGAFHDAQFVVPICPTGMLFVPCHKGISHNPAEYSRPEQLAAGTRVLARALVALAG